MTRKNAQKIAARARQREHGGSYAAHHRIVGGGGTRKPKPWTCSVCKELIDPGAGYVLIMDAETFGYPRKATSTEVTLTKEAIEKRRSRGEPTEPPFGGISLGEIEDTPNRIAFDAVHSDCDPHPDTDPYWLAVEGADSLEAWCHWVHHVCEKGWMSTLDIRRMIAFWFLNRGEDFDD